MQALVLNEQRPKPKRRQATPSLAALGIDLFLPQ